MQFLVRQDALQRFAQVQIGLSEGLMLCVYAVKGYLSWRVDFRTFGLFLEAGDFRQLAGILSQGVVGRVVFAVPWFTHFRFA